MLEKILLHIVFIVLFLCLLNRKNNIVPIIGAQFRIYKNNRTNRIHKIDCLVFILSPIVLSLLLVLGCKVLIPKQVVEYIITIVSIFFGLFLTFVGLLIPNINNNNERVKYIKESFITALFSMIISIIILSFDVIYLSLLNNDVTNIIFSILNYTFLIELLYCILLLIKRIYNIFYD